MADYFALLDEPRRPWLDPEILKDKFHALAATVHPDRVHRASEPEKQEANQRYAELNAAYRCLREPTKRLRHLLELERGKKIEDVGHDLGRYADSGILNANEDCCILLRHGQIDKAAMCELSGIAQ